MYQLQIYYIFVLKEFLGKIFGTHYPIEIIALIIMAIYKPIKISCGWYHSTLISDNVYVWGSNVYGKLGIGNKFDTRLPTKFVIHGNVDLIKCGAQHTIALINTFTGTEIYVWGGNSSGQLGLGNTRDRDSIERLYLSDIISVDCGAYYTVALTKFGKCYVWGSLGFGNDEDRCSPQELPNLKDVIGISCGAYCIFALVKSNKCYVWGNNEYGQLGLGHYNEQKLPSELNLINIVSIQCGNSHTVALIKADTSKSNECYIWGNNDRGQLGLGHNQNQNKPQKLYLLHIISVSCGGYHTIALTKTGTLYVWGLNTSGLE